MTPSEPASDPADALRARKRRNLILGAALVAFVALVFLVTIVQLQGAVLNRPL